MRLMMRGLFALMILFVLATAAEPLSAAIRHAFPVFGKAPAPILSPDFARRPDLRDM